MLCPLLTVLRLLVHCAYWCVVLTSVLCPVLLYVVHLICCNCFTIIIFIICVEVPVLLETSALPDVTLVQMGNDVTLQCPLMVTTPTPTLLWLANGSVVQMDDANFTISAADNTAEGIYQCLVEGSFTPTTNRAGLPPVISFVTTTFVDVFCKRVCSVCVRMCVRVHACMFEW